MTNGGKCSICDKPVTHWPIDDWFRYCEDHSSIDNEEWVSNFLTEGKTKYGNYPFDLVTKWLFERKEKTGSYPAWFVKERKKTEETSDFLYFRQKFMKHFAAEEKK
jgi:hypothetical protein